MIWHLTYDIHAIGINMIYSNPRISFNNWLTGSQALPGNRCHSCSASAQTMEAEPPDMRYQALPCNEYNHLGLL